VGSASPLHAATGRLQAQPRVGTSGRRQPRWRVPPGGERECAVPSASANYLTLLRTSGAATFFLPAAVGLLGIARTGIGIVWLVHARTGAYAAAGLVTGGFSVADAVAGPRIGRLVDRFGQARVLPGALGAQAGAVALLLVGAVADLVAGVPVGAHFPSSVPCPPVAGPRCCPANGLPRRPPPSPWRPSPTACPTWPARLW
jgi:hypothetical protein